MKEEASEMGLQGMDPEERWPERRSGGQKTGEEGDH